jgi:hypothetical protein
VIRGLILRRDAEPDVIGIEGRHTDDFSCYRAGRANRDLRPDSVELLRFVTECLGLAPVFDSLFTNGPVPGVIDFFK